MLAGAHVLDCRGQITTDHRGVGTGGAGEELKISFLFSYRNETVLLVPNFMLVKRPEQSKSSLSIILAYLLYLYYT